MIIVRFVGLIRQLFKAYAAPNTQMNGSHLNLGHDSPLVVPFAQALGSIALHVRILLTPWSHLGKKLLQTTAHF